MSLATDTIYRKNLKVNATIVSYSMPDPLYTYIWFVNAWFVVNF